MEWQHCDELIHLLTTWRFLPGETRTIGVHDDLLNTVSGSFDDVEVPSPTGSLTTRSTPAPMRCF
jgi:hypothetical protein